MKTSLLILIGTIAMLGAACHASKKKMSSTVSSTPRIAPPAAPPITAAPAPNYEPARARPATGIYAPGAEELEALQTRYADATLDQLKEGHAIYTTGACVGCHAALSIYQREEARWKPIMDDMAKRAELTDEQKNAVYKYVLAIKVTQANRAR